MTGINLRKLILRIVFVAVIEPVAVTGQSAPSGSITTTKVNSLLICLSSDYNAIDGSSRTYRDGAVENHYYFSSGATSAYHYYKTATSVTTYTEGLTAPTGQSAGTVILEVRVP